MEEDIELAKIKGDYNLLVRVVSMEKGKDGWKQTKSSNFTVYPKSEVKPETVKEKIENYMEKFKE